MKKGDISGNIFKIIKLNLDCDNDSIKITVRKSEENQ
jgi:phosphoribosyl-AMP cyclohydrolase